MKIKLSPTVKLLKGQRYFGCVTTHHLKMPQAYAFVLSTAEENGIGTFISIIGCKCHCVKVDVNY